MGFSRGHIRGVEGVINPGQDRPVLYDRTVVNRRAVLIFTEGEDHTGNLGPDIHHFFGLHRAGGADRRLQVAPLHLDRAEPGRLAAAMQQVSQEQKCHHRRRQGDEPGPLIGKFHF